MYKIHLVKNEIYSSEKNEFYYVPETIIHFEHSLLAISEWEAKYKKPFLHTEKKTVEENLDYIKMMAIEPDIPDEYFEGLTYQDIKGLYEYMNDKRTASTMPKTKQGKKSSYEFITSELIYYWMVALEIPFECEKWHINRLLMLINITNAKNQPTKKMPQKEHYSRQRAANMARRAKTGSTG